MEIHIESKSNKKKMVILTGFVIIPILQTKNENEEHFIFNCSLVYFKYENNEKLTTIALSKANEMSIIDSAQYFNKIVLTPYFRKRTQTSMLIHLKFILKICRINLHAVGRERKTQN